MKSYWRIILRELGWLVIATLLVILSFVLTGTFFNFWIKDVKLISILSLIFYGVIGVYRILNWLARKSQNSE
ncbi:hypothetical protein ACFLU5_10030 [Bacteroidota bacterium]